MNERQVANMALELASELEAASSEMEYNHVVSDWELLSNSATMLRQQQAKLTKYELRHAEQRKRIDELEAELKLIDELVRGKK